MYAYLFFPRCPYGENFIDHANKWYVSSGCHALGSLVIVSYLTPLLMTLTRNCMTCVRLHHMRHNLAWKLDIRKDMVALSLVWIIVLLCVVVNAILTPYYDEYCVAIQPWPCLRKLVIMEYIVFLALNPLNILFFFLKQSVSFC